MKNIRIYGKSPYNIVLIHGGPGAAGEMAPVAKRLSKNTGVIEALQTKDSISGQISELKKILIQNSKIPAVLVGYSWGAWLGIIFTAKYPKLVKKLIIISSGPFEENYAKKIMETRLSRLSEKNKSRLKYLLTTIDTLKKNQKSKAFTEIGKIISYADSVSYLSDRTKINLNYDIYLNVWKEAENLRRSEKLLGLFKKIKCPLVAIHGGYDPHPFQGVKIPFQKYHKNSKFILLKNCGHIPWNEKYSKLKFFEILIKEIT